MARYRSFLSLVAFVLGAAALLAAAPARAQLGGFSIPFLGDLSGGSTGGLIPAEIADLVSGGIALGMSGMTPLPEGLEDQIGEEDGLQDVDFVSSVGEDDANEIVAGLPVAIPSATEISALGNPAAAGPSDEESIIANLGVPIPTAGDVDALGIDLAPTANGDDVTQEDVIAALPSGLVPSPPTGFAEPSQSQPDDAEEAPADDLAPLQSAMEVVFEEPSAPAEPVTASGSSQATSATPTSSDDSAASADLEVILPNAVSGGMMAAAAATDSGRINTIYGSMMAAGSNIRPSQIFDAREGAAASGESEDTSEQMPETERPEDFLSYLRGGASFGRASGTYSQQQASAVTTGATSFPRVATGWNRGPAGSNGFGQFVSFRPSGNPYLGYAG